MSPHQDNTDPSEWSDAHLDSHATAYVYGELADTVAQPDPISDLVDWQLRQGLARRHA